MTIHSLSDLSNNTEPPVTIKKKRKWNYQEWMNEEPVSIVCDSNGASHPLCQFPLTIGVKRKKEI